MRKIIWSTAVLALMGLFLIPLGRVAEAKDEALSSHSLTLSHWKYSSESEQRAFLMGFISALGMEKMWQADKPQPIEKSLVGVWARGLDGLSYPEICRTLNEYITQHPEQMDEDVMKVLADIYVRPKMTQDERKEASAHYAKIRGERRQ